MRGQHRPGYRKPRTGERRQVRQPFAIDKLPEAVRQEILRARAEGATWEETAERATKAAAQPVSASMAHRWYYVRVDRVQKDVLAQAERARALAATFAQKGFRELPEAALNALSAEIFGAMEAKSPDGRAEALGKLVFLLSKLITAQAKEKSVEIESRKLDLARKKFEELRAKGDKATNEAAAKLGKGRTLTIEDINRIRERVFGLAPAAAGSRPA